MQDITRRQDDSGLRWYTDGDNRAMSVTTVLGFLEEDTSGLDYWKSQNQGVGDDFHHEHVYWYSAPRGTLCHFAGLNPLTDDNMWGDEERDSLQQLVDGPDESELTFTDEYEVPETDESSVVYSLLRNKEIVTSEDQFELLFGDMTILDVGLSDIEWFAKSFSTVADELDIPANTIAVEQYLLDFEAGYGGQCDLLYEDRDGNTVLADLKTSSSLRQKHILQAVAYGRAVERADDIDVATVDRHEVIRCCPEDTEVVVHTDVPPSDASETLYETANWHESPYGDYSFDDTDDIYDSFATCVDTALDEVDY